MSSTTRYFRPTSLDDFSKNSYEGLGISSYKHAAFPLGCSTSEFEMSLDDREITLLQEKNTPVAFFRIKSATETNMFFDLFYASDLNDEGIAPLQALMSHLLESYEINKFFVQLFDHEVKEKALLRHFGFEEEARLTDQTWLQGKYQDVVIMGSKLHV